MALCNICWRGCGDSRKITNEDMAEIGCGVLWAFVSACWFILGIFGIVVDFAVAGLHRVGVG